MTDGTRVIAAGVDAGTECLKAVIVSADGQVLGRAVVASRGHFEACAHEVLAAALDDAQRDAGSLAGIGATGFAMNCVTKATLTSTDAACHALGAFHHLRHAMTLVEIGGRDPHVITVDDAGRRADARSVRKCAAGVGSFLMFTARHLDVSATGLQDLAAAGERPARVSSYCSVFSTTEVLERLREGARREEIALGAMYSIAERIVEMGPLDAPLHVCGGVAEFFPGVLTALSTLTGQPVRAVPEPILTGALGAALKVLEAVGVAGEAQSVEAVR
ncbi:MAG: acyl-CoA dehydratase activase [Gemmatimonadota bacterium]|nr:acyl-CoA dehydratase activase [Gemmatimonadota bacterium]